jgi:hypothetical protein
MILFVLNKIQLNNVYIGKGHFRIVNKLNGSFEYFGEFKNDQIDGEGQAFYKNGEVYTGQFAADQRNGIYIYSIG